MQRLACAVAVFAVFVPAAFAENAPTLPPSAKRLAGATIAELYDGTTYTFESYTSFGMATGEVSYDLKAGTNRGAYRLGPHKGTFGGQIRITRDRFCYKTPSTGERCNDVYLDGADIYEVRGSGIVDSVKRAK
jgi:hypothetical protein